MGEWMKKVWQSFWIMFNEMLRSTHIRDISNSDINFSSYTYKDEGKWMNVTFLRINTILYIIK